MRKQLIEDKVVNIIKEIFGITTIEVLTNTGEIEDLGAYYFSHPAKNIGSAIVNKKGGYLAVSSDVSFKDLLISYKLGKRGDFRES